MKQVIGDSNATQEAVNLAVETMKTSIAHVRLDQAKRSLKLEINIAEKIDQTMYTKESFANLTKVLQGAKAILNDDKVNLIKLEEMAQKIRIVLSQLVKKPSQPEGPVTPPFDLVSKEHGVIVHGITDKQVTLLLLLLRIKTISIQYAQIIKFSLIQRY